MPSSRTAKNQRLHEPSWVIRTQVLAIIVCIALTGFGIYMLMGTDTSAGMSLMTITAGLITVLLIVVRALVSRGAMPMATMALNAGVFIFSIVMTLADSAGGRVLLFVPSLAIAMSQIYLYAPRSLFVPTILWSAISLALLFGERLGMVPHTPWYSGIGWVNTLAHAVGMILSLSWRYDTSVNELGKVSDDNRALERMRADLEARVEASTESLKEREARFRAVSELTSDYAFGWRITADQQIISEWSTDAIVKVTGYTREEFESNWRTIVDPEDHNVYEQRLRRVLNNDTNVAEFRIVYKGTDETRWLKAFTRPIWSDHERRVVKAIGAIQDITEQRVNADEIEKLAYYDSLTGFGNRKVWKTWADVAIAKSNLTKSPLAILYLDLDRFKAVNDTLGHDVGDVLLVEVSNRVYSCLDSDDRLARLGGDEFAILLLDSDEERGVAVARCVLGQFEAPFKVRGHTIQAKCSVGIAVYPRDGNHINVLQQHAEIGMYRAKTKAEHYQVYNPEISTYMDEQVQLEAELSEAISSNDQLALHFQPILNIAAGTIEKAEALVRWMNPKRGPVSPGVFIPLAEESGAILEVDRWVLRTAFQQVAEWLRIGKRASLSVNISAITVHDGDFLRYVTEQLKRTQAAPELITLEITESAAIEDPEATNRVLHSLRKMGFRLAIDDFGRGYTSIVFLKNLPVDFVKIDKSFIDGIGVDSKDEGVLRAVLALAKGLDILTVAEGVEQLAQVEWLREHGCDFIQGWYVGKAMPGDQYLSLVERVDRTAEPAVS